MEPRMLLSARQAKRKMTVGYKIHHLIFFKNQFTVTGKIDRFVVIGLQGILPGKKHLMITVLINSRLILFFIGRSNFRFLSAV